MVHDPAIAKVHPRIVLVFAACLLTSACLVVVEEASDTTTLRFGSDTVPSTLLGSLMVFGGGIGLALLKVSDREQRWLLVTASVFASVIIAALGPLTSDERVVITPSEIHYTSTFTSSDRGFRYQDVSSIAIRSVRERGFYWERHWFVNLVDGRRYELDPPDLWDHHEDLIVAKLRGFGVSFGEIEE